MRRLAIRATEGPREMRGGEMDGCGNTGDRQRLIELAVDEVACTPQQAEGLKIIGGGHRGNCIPGHARLKRGARAGSGPVGWAHGNRSRNRGPPGQRPGV